MIVTKGSIVRYVLLLHVLGHFIYAQDNISSIIDSHTSAQSEQTADILFLKELFYEAIPFYTDALSNAESSDQPYYHYQLGLCYEQVYMFAKAAQHFSKIPQHSFNHYPNALLKLGLVLKAQQQYNLAMHNLTRFIEEITWATPDDVAMARKQINICRIAIKESREYANINVEALPNTINHRYRSSCPRIHNTNLYFTAMKEVAVKNEVDIDNLSGKYRSAYVSRLFVSLPKGKNGWKRKQEVNVPLPSETASLESFDINAAGEVLFTVCNAAEKNTCEIYKGQLSENDIINIEVLSEPINIGNTSSKDPTWLKKNTFIYASNRYPINGYDLYEASLTDGEIISLKGMNTKANEQSPYFDESQNALYFSADWTSGYGYDDIYKATRKSKGKFSIPELLPVPINSTATDMYPFVLSKKSNQLFVSSNRYLDNSKKNVIHDQLLKITQQNDTDIKASFALNGKVSNEAGNEGLNATVKVFDPRRNKLVGETKTNVNGSYVLNLPPEKELIIEAGAKGYFFFRERFFISMEELYLKKALKNIALQKIYVGSKLILEDIYFESGASVLSEQSYLALEQVYEFLINNPQLTIEVSGHTDAEGNADYNQHLSEQRAQSVAGYLHNLGIPANRVSSKGYGYNQPIAGNDNKEGRMLNRRVEINILSIAPTED